MVDHNLMIQINKFLMEHYGPPHFTDMHARSGRYLKVISYFNAAYPNTAPIYVLNIIEKKLVRLYAGDLLYGNDKKYRNNVCKVYNILRKHYLKHQEEYEVRQQKGPNTTASSREMGEF